MTIVKPSVKILRCDGLEIAETGAAICKNRAPNYAKSSNMAMKLAASGHWSVLEHVVISAEIITSRNISHQFVRHRLASYSERSTSQGKIEFIICEPWWWDEKPEWQHSFLLACEQAIRNFEAMRKDLNMPKHAARDVLPGCLATKLLVTANIREWAHIYQLRSKPPAHPDFQRLMKLFANELWKYYPTHATIVEGCL